MCLVPFKFTVNHKRGALTRMYTEQAVEDLEGICGALLESLPLVYSSLEDHHRGWVL